MNREVTYCDLDLIDYREAWDLQKELLELRHRKKTGDILLLLEHPNTYTLGKTADKKNMISSDRYLDENGISVYEIDRGGDITYHGPGQLVGYPLIDLTAWYRDAHKYLRSLEEVIIKTCSHYGINAGRKDKYTGVWINNKKIAAIGVKISRWITMHGFAFNINTDLKLFRGIIPCGIPDCEVTSLNEETGKLINMQDVKARLLLNFKEIFGYTSIREISREELPALDFNLQKG